MREPHRKYIFDIEGLVGGAISTAQAILAITAAAAQPVRIEEMLLSSAEVDTSQTVLVQWATNHASDAYTNDPETTHLHSLGDGTDFGGSVASDGTTTGAVAAGTVWRQEVIRCGATLQRFYGTGFIIPPAAVRRLVLTATKASIAWYGYVIFSIPRP